MTDQNEPVDIAQTLADNAVMRLVEVLVAAGVPYSKIAKTFVASAHKLVLMSEDEWIPEWPAHLDKLAAEMRTHTPETGVRH